MGGEEDRAAVLKWLLLFVPLTLALHFLKPESQTLIFLAACMAIVPLAGQLGKATEQLAHHTGDAVGGLLNATFGNAAELIIAVMALREGLYSVVKASLTGSIIGNILLVLGAAALAGGTRHKRQQFNRTGACAQATLLTLAAIGLIAPAAFHHLGGSAARPREDVLSLAIALVLFAAYASHLLFSLITHKQMCSAEPDEAANVAPASIKRALISLAVSTAFIAWISEILVGSVEHAAAAFGMTGIFLGVIVVAVVGNAAEHSTAVMMAMRNRMEIAVAIAIGSSLQIALFVAPLLVLVSRLVGPRPMDLVFTPAEVLAVFLAVMITGQIASDGETNWLEGVQLLAVYLILAVVFYFLPESAALERG
jgi:Ca2+:H+ antiporter